MLGTMIYMRGGAGDAVEHYTACLLRDTRGFIFSSPYMVCCACGGYSVLRGLLWYSYNVGLCGAEPRKRTEKTRGKGKSKREKLLSPTNPLSADNCNACLEIASEGGSVLVPETTGAGRGGEVGGTEELMSADRARLWGRPG